MHKIGKLYKRNISAAGKSWKGTKLALTKACTLWLGAKRIEFYAFTLQAKHWLGACAFFNHNAHMSQRKAALKVI